MNNADVIAKIDKALATVSALCEGEIRWTMRVPAEPENDPDLIIAGALQAAKNALAAAAPVSAMTEPVVTDEGAMQLADAIDPFTRKVVPGHTTLAWAAKVLRTLAAAAPVADDKDKRIAALEAELKEAIRYMPLACAAQEKARAVLAAAPVAAPTKSSERKPSKDWPASTKIGRIP